MLKVLSPSCDVGLPAPKVSLRLRTASRRLIGNTRICESLACFCPCRRSLSYCDAPESARDLRELLSRSTLLEDHRSSSGRVTQPIINYDRVVSVSVTMASATAPTTPEATAPFPLMRRSFTLPPKLPELRRSSYSSKQEEKPAVETLFAHHNCKIVSFSPSSATPKKNSSSGRGNDEVENEPVGTLPWKTNSERTIAAGMS